MRLSLAAGVLLLLASASDALAWGDLGHRVVCEIAFRQVAHPTRERIKDLIRADRGFARFADACTWPDHPRQRAAEHFVNLPRNAGELGSDGCPLADRCVVSAIEEDHRILSSPAETSGRKLDALKFLGHWVGDVHQPLHVSFRDDRGGNSIDVEGSCGGDLHAAWDGCLLERTLGRDVQNIATTLIAGISPEAKERWVASEPTDWANESFRITVSAAARYCVIEGGACKYEEGNEELGPGEAEKVVAIDAAYVTANGPIIRERLQQAGIRLARLLDQTLGQ